MRRALASLALVVTLAAVPGPAALAASDDFTFFGSGFGHGLGLSQWGTYGLAQEGWRPAQILTHFYSRTSVEPVKDVPRTLRIGLTQGQEKIRLGARGGRVDLRLGGRQPSDTIATIPGRETWTIRETDGRYRILDANGDQVGDPVGGTATDLFAVYEQNGARVDIPEASHTYGRGYVEFNLYGCAASCDIRLILVIGPEPYLYGLAEVPSSWPMEALQAQAIAARSYALSKAAAGQHRPVCNCALYATSFDQVYAGWDKESGLDGERWVQAVDDTAGEVVTFQDEVIQAFYMSSSGGHTEDNENVWGGSPISWLRGVCDPGDYTTANPSATWRVTISAGEVTQRLGLGIGTVRGFTSIDRGVSGRILSATVRGENGTAIVTGGTLRAALGLRDDRVWINRNRQIVGAIRDKYDALDCSPGLATSRQVSVAGGRRQAFEDATIFHSDATGAHALHGVVLEFYESKRGPAGTLGFPTTDVRKLKSGNLRASFEHGVVTCTPTGACSIS
ncbi:MAG TPA: SpoIID/LytB domain-containing protein [Actinomycetota bacterium]|nr:SpoIID/LytB domain-containing protein [Actinomycetota bacterium]